MGLEQQPERMNRARDWNGWDGPITESGSLLGEVPPSLISPALGLSLLLPHPSSSLDGVVELPRFGAKLPSGTLPDCGAVARLSLTL